MLEYRNHAFNGYNYYTHRHGEVHDDIFAWLATIPLSRPVWHYGEDFADGILTGDIIDHFFPELIDLNALHAARNMGRRTANWHYLNNEVFPKIDLYIPHIIIVDITNGVHHAVELFLIQLREAIQRYWIQMRQTSHSQRETGLSFNGNHRLPQGQTTGRRHGVLPAITGAISPNSTGANPSANGGANQSGIPGANKSGIKGANKSSFKDANNLGMKGANCNDGYQDPSLAPCREALRLKDKEIDELREKMKTCEKLVREKVKIFEKMVHTRDDRIQHLETQLEKMRSKRS